MPRKSKHPLERYAYVLDPEVEQLRPFAQLIANAQTNASHQTCKMAILAASKYAEVTAFETDHAAGRNRDAATLTYIELRIAMETALKAEEIYHAPSVTDAVMRLGYYLFYLPEYSQFK